MIWFACKQCGKAIRQADNAAGSLVFCACGEGNRVPWESTIAPAPAPPAEALPAQPAEDDDYPSRRRQREIIARDPAYCWNHQDIRAERLCDDCGENFCAACLVALRGKTLCAPCKNFRLARLQRPPQLVAKSILALVLAILGGPLSFCLSAIGRADNPGLSAFSLGFGIAGLLLPAVGLLLALTALGEMNRDSRLGGRAVAITAAVTAVVGLVWSLTMLLVLVAKTVVD